MELLVGPLVDKMFAEPSNPIIVKFPGYISEHLGGAADIVFQRILLHTESQTEAVPLFRLCMANVLISACQKISDSGKIPFALELLRRITHSISNVKEPEIRSACIQALFSSVYHLRSVVLPYSSDLLKASLESLKRGSEMERMGGAKLLAGWCQVTSIIDGKRGSNCAKYFRGTVGSKNLTFKYISDRFFIKH